MKILDLIVSAAPALFAKNHYVLTNTATLCYNGGGGIFMKTVLNTIIWIHVSVWLVLVAGFLFPAMSIILYALLAAATLLSRAITEVMIWLMVATKFVPDFFVQNPAQTLLAMLYIFLVIKVFNIIGNILIGNILIFGLIPVVSDVTKSVVVRPNSESHKFSTSDGICVTFDINGDRVSIDGSFGPTHQIISRVAFKMLEKKCKKENVTVIHDQHDPIVENVSWAKKIWAFLFL